MDSWELIAPIIASASPVLLFLLSVMLRSADSRAKDKTQVKIEAGANITASPLEEALRQDIRQEAEIARLTERNISLAAEKDRLLKTIARRDATIARRDAVIEAQGETIRILRGERP